MTRAKGGPAFSEALLRAKKAYNAQAMRDGRPSVSEHDLEEAVWAVFDLLRDDNEYLGDGEDEPAHHSSCKCHVCEARRP